MKERIYLGGFEIYREYAGDGQTVTLARETLHLMDDKQRIALVETRTQGNDGSPPQLIRYQLGNHLGSASLELDDQAQIISYEEFYPYGSTSYQAVRSQTETPKRYRYTGKERDEESGLYYHGARYYAAWLGRWVGCDPTGFADGTNLYRYSRDNPINLHDPSGTQPMLSANDPRIKAYEQRLNQVRGRLVPVHPGNPPIQSFRVKGAGTGKGAHFGPAPTLPDPWKKEGTGSPAGSQSPHGTQSQPMGTSDISQPGNADASRSGSAVDASGYQEAGANRTSGVGGTGKDKSAMSTPLTELDYATLLASVLSPLESEQSKEGVSGGIPGGKGPKWMASPVGQAVYIAINLFFTFFSGVVESGLRKAWTAAKPFVKSLLVAPAFMAVGVGGPGGGSWKAALAVSRRAARTAAIKEALESLRAGNPTPQALHLAERIEAVYGREALVDFMETGKLPEGVEFSHLFSAAEYPEFSHRGDLGVLTDQAEHRFGHHAGDTRVPLHGTPRIPGED
jgi:RHS repeat-associated protein